VEIIQQKKVITVKPIAHLIKMGPWIFISSDISLLGYLNIKTIIRRLRMKPNILK